MPSTARAGQTARRRRRYAHSPRGWPRATKRLADFQRLGRRRAAKRREPLGLDAGRRRGRAGGRRRGPRSPRSSCRRTAEPWTGRPSPMTCRLVAISPSPTTKPYPGRSACRRDRCRAGRRSTSAPVRPARSPTSARDRLVSLSPAESGAMLARRRRSDTERIMAISAEGRTGAAGLLSVIAVGMTRPVVPRPSFPRSAWERTSGRSASRQVKA